MYIVIAGAGGVGALLAKTLGDRGHNVVVVERDKSVCADLAAEVAGLVINGDATDKGALEDAGTSRADIFVAVMGSDSDNIVSCLLAKSDFKVPRVIAKVSDVRKAKLLQGAGIDFILSVPFVTLKALEVISLIPHATPTLISDTPIQTVDLEIPPSATGSARFGDISVPRQCAIVALHRKDKWILPGGDTVIAPGDVLTIAGELSAIRAAAEGLLKRFGVKT